MLRMYSSIKPDLSLIMDAKARDDTRVSVWGTDNMDSLHSHAPSSSWLCSVGLKDGDLLPK